MLEDAVAKAPNRLRSRSNLIQTLVANKQIEEAQRHLDLMPAPKLDDELELFALASAEVSDIMFIANILARAGVKAASELGEQDALARLGMSSQRLAEVLDTQTLEINSAHHQSNGRPGDGLKVVATASDGIVEAIEEKLEEDRTRSRKAKLTELLSVGDIQETGYPTVSQTLSFGIQYTYARGNT